MDSMTNEVIAADAEECTAGFRERFSKRGSVEDAFTYWTKRGVKSVDVLKTPK